MENLSRQRKMSSIHLEKKGLRGLAIAESFKHGDKKSKLAGIVMRRDYVIDGFVFGSCTVEGDDATDAIIKMHAKLERADINFILISGMIIALYNVIDIKQITKETRLPVIGVTYKTSSGIKDAIEHHFPNSSKSKITQYEKLGTRSQIKLPTGHTIYIRTEGCTTKEAQKILNDFTLQGSVPEPLRIAHLLANSL